MSMNFVQRHEQPLSAGVDWLTCTHRDIVPGGPFDDVATAVLNSSLEDGETARLGTWQGYAGLKTPRAFYGWRGNEGAVWISGPHNPALVSELIRSADNVSRIDLQLTVEHTPADPRLGAINYRRAAAYDGRPGQRPVVTELHDTHGSHTTSIGSRISDQYGRHYDKGVQAKIAPAGKLWRFEVEYKRKMAEKIARQVANARELGELTAYTVWQWWTTRGVPPTARPPRGCLIDTRLPGKTSSDYLSWFESKLSRSVRRAVESHGLHPVLRSLGLLNQVEDAYTQEAASNDNQQHDIQAHSRG